MYEVKLTPVQGGKSTTLKGVKGDMPGNPNEGLGGLRIFILEDESRVEVPMNEFIVTFSAERFKLLLKNAEKEAGQKLPV